MDIIILIILIISFVLTYGLFGVLNGEIDKVKTLIKQQQEDIYDKAVYYTDKDGSKVVIKQKKPKPNSFGIN